jgi:hypothetical protein
VKKPRVFNWQKAKIKKLHKRIDPVKDELLYAYGALLDIERLHYRWGHPKPEVLTFSYTLPVLP